MKVFSIPEKNFELPFTFCFPQRAAGVLSRTLPSSLKIVEEALKAGVVKKMIKFLKVKYHHCLQPLEFPGVSYFIEGTKVRCRYFTPARF